MPTRERDLFQCDHNSRIGESIEYEPGVQIDHGNSQQKSCITAGNDNLGSGSIVTVQSEEYCDAQDLQYERANRPVTRQPATNDRRQKQQRRFRLGIVKAVVYKTGGSPSMPPDNSPWLN